MLMSIALIGATGNAGSRILDKLVRRNHAVIAIVRDISKVPALTGVTAKAGNVNDADGLAALIAGHNAVISSVHFSASDPEKLIAAVRKAKVPRYLVVGGAGSLEVAPGTRLIDTPGFPDAYRKEAGGGAAFLDRLRETHDT
jgi:hypothetical protein